MKCKYVWTEVGKSSQNDRVSECPYVKAKYKMIWKRLCLWSVSMSELKLENHLKTTESQIWFNYYGIIFCRKMTECQISPDIVVFRAKCWENDWVSDLVQLLWDNIFFEKWQSVRFRFQSKVLRKRLSLRFGSITMG